MQRSDWSKWEIVMRAKLNSLVENQIWDLIKQSSQNVIIERWTFRLKRDRDDNSQRYKVRWVAHDFKQRHEVDFDETFAFVIKFISYKTLMTISIIRELQIRLSIHWWKHEARSRADHVTEPLDPEWDPY
jgi:hypothetical protein